MAREHPSDYRWSLWRGVGSPNTISVIEPGEKRKPDPQARRVPFGFSRVLDEPQNADPLLWEGED